MSPNSPNDDYTIECYIRPGLSWSPEKQREFVAELREVVMGSFGFTHESQLPAYQCLDETPEGAGLNDKVIVVARERVQWPSDRRGKMLAFNSAVLLSIPRISTPVLHLGLTCILPCARSYGLTKVLTARVVIQTFLRFNALRRNKLNIHTLLRARCTRTSRLSSQAAPAYAKRCTSPQTVYTTQTSRSFRGV